MNPLIHHLLGDTVEDIRHILAVLAAATADPTLAWDRTGPGVTRLLGIVDDALEDVTQTRQGWAHKRPPETPCGPIAGPSDEPDPLLDRRGIVVVLALRPTEYGPLADTARAWGVLPETLARTLVIDGLAEIAKRAQGDSA